MGLDHSKGVPAVDLTRAQWRKSSRSGGNIDGNCVEVAFVGPVAGVRDSKNPVGPMLVVPAAAWTAFVKR
ncbi:MAG TPA: DUF397 domain-containing protein [Pseudonocardiaceae bacterium]|nr:DUF397 domain-containing protein [Pseudonocardiaceae bacterium]